MREIKKILVLAYEYFPMENANTKIVRNLCGLLAESCSVDLVTSAKPGMPGPEYDGKVHVIRVPEYSFHREKCTGQLTPGILVRMISLTRSSPLPVSALIRRAPSGRSGRCVRSPLV